MKKTIILSFVLSFLCYNTNAQSGKAFGKVFSNFNYDMSPAEGEDSFKEFELKRAYLGYSYKIDDKFSTKITFDVGNNTGGTAYTAFLKIAQLNWKYNDNVNINFGMIGTKNFKFMEKAWGKRYIYKSLQDQNKWANSADLGVTLDYSLNKNISFDFQVLNGDGYKKVQGSNGLMRGGVGLIYSINKLSVRAATDIAPRSSYEANTDNQTINTLAAVYNMGAVKIGGEYNIQENADNVIDNKKIGRSVYGDYSLGNDLSVFGRYDVLESEDNLGNQWNLSKDGNMMIIGVQKKMTKGVTVAMNVQSWQEATLETEEEADRENTFYINLEYKF